MAISRAQLVKELEPGLNALFGLEYKNYANEHAEIFDSENSDRAFEEEVMLSGFGNANVKPEGQSVNYDSATETFTARYTHETLALAFSITEEAMEDNLYDTFAKVRARALARAMANTKQVKAAAIFNNGFTAGDSAIGDGQAFFSASHPVVGGGTQSNILAAADLSESALETALIAIDATKDDRGILIGTQAVSLHIPSDLKFTAERLLASPGKVGSNHNDINAVRNMGVVPNGYFVNRRFTNSNDYYIKTDVPNGAKMFVRVPLQTKMEPDFDTGNVRFKSRERYSFGVSDWRSYYGSQGA